MALTQISTKGVKDGTILNADVNASAAIAGTKISTSFGNQDIQSNQIQIFGKSVYAEPTSEDFFRIKFNDTGGINNDVGIGQPDSASLAFNTISNGTIRFYNGTDGEMMRLDASGNLAIGGISNVGTKLHIENASGDAHIRLRGSANYGILFTRHSDAALTGYVGSGNAVNLGTSNIAISASLSGGDIILQTNGTAATDEKMRIKSNGNIQFTSQNATGWQLNAGDDSASYTAIDNHFPTTNRTIYFNVETTHRSVAFWNKNGSDGYGFGLDNSGNFKVVSGTVERFKIGANVTIANEAFAAGNVAIDPDSYAAYTGGFGNVNDGGSWGARGMWVHGGGTGDAAAIAHNGSNLYFGLQNGSAVNSMATYMMIEPTGDICMEKNVKLTATVLRRSQHQTGHLEGGYNNIGSSDVKSNPIFTIGSAYNPAETTLSNMFGIGYCTNSASFINNAVTSNWGMYVAADGDARVFFGGSDGRIFATSYNRTSHQTGHLEGGYINIGASETKTSPIYTIGSNYNPNEGTLANMYGVGYSKGDASFLPTGSNWGFYAAANGIARIFLDTGSGTARIYFGSNLASDTRFISAPTGDYGSMQINNGPTSGWRGYSIDGHSVFMSNGTTAVTNYIGIYDDNINQWSILHARTAWVRLYYGGGSKLETTNTGVTINGTVTATNLKSFRISHPLSELSETKDLVHAAIEGPQMDLMYRGKVDLVNGTATVNIDTKSGMTEGTFDVLNRDVQCFTTNETGWTNVKGSVTGNKLTIVAENNSCTDTISWIVIGERKDNDVISSEVTDDNGDLIVEPDKQVIDDEPKMDS